MRWALSLSNFQENQYIYAYVPYTIVKSDERQESYFRILYKERLQRSLSVTDILIFLRPILTRSVNGAYASV